MWLINTTTLELHEFIDADHAPPYAILSHLWGQDEVSFKDFRKKRKTTGQGYKKIVDCCAFTKQHGLQWVWIDTCCIDKRSSAELTEAINSMFSWYAMAEVCFAHLDDLTADVSDGENLLLQFRKSRWFTRGWTLQELIAPKEVTFVTSEWHVYGSKCVDLTDIIEKITGIPEGILRNPDRTRLRGISVARRMSWAAGRQTTRKEDVAYSLLGLFGINMPLLYGEGEHAFTRLQIEIISRTTDESIYAWTSKQKPKKHDGLVHVPENMLAYDPTCFAASSAIRSLDLHWRLPISFSHGEFVVHLEPNRGYGAFFNKLEQRYMMLQLNCADHANGNSRAGSVCVIYLRRTGCGHYVRLFIRGLAVEDQIERQDEWAEIDRAATLRIHPSAADEVVCRQRDLSFDRKFVASLGDEHTSGSYSWREP